MAFDLPGIDPVKNKVFIVGLHYIINFIKVIISDSYSYFLIRVSTRPRGYKRLHAQLS